MTADKNKQDSDNPNENINKESSTSNSLVNLIKNHTKAVALALMGTLSAALIPIWQIYYVQTPDIQIEVSSIDRIEDNSYRVLLDTDELQLLEPYIEEAMLYEFDALGNRGDKISYPTFSLSTLWGAYDKAKQDQKNISDIKSSLQETIERIDHIQSDENKHNQLAEFRISELKQWDLSNHIDDAEARYYEQQVLELTRDYSRMEFKNSETPQINIEALEYLLTDVKEDINDVIKSSTIRHEKLRDHLASIESQLLKLNQIQLEKHTYFKVDVIASNMGRVSSSLRPLALIRVQISDDNYVDIRLYMENYKNQAELLPSSTNIIQFRSKTLRTFPVEDQQLINTFWGSTGKVRLYTLDTNQQVYVSNQIAFVSNLNLKVMLDKLKETASAHQ